MNFPIESCRALAIARRESRIRLRLGSSREAKIEAIQFGLLFVLLLAGCGGHEVDFARSLAVPLRRIWFCVNGKIITVDRDFSIQAKRWPSKTGGSSLSAPSAICAR